MRTTVSIPDDLFERAERFAGLTEKSRSQLYSDAVREYVARHAPEEITNAMDRVVELVDGHKDRFVSSAARRRLMYTEW